MKTVLCLLAIVVLAFAEQEPETFAIVSDTIKDYLEDIRERLSCNGPVMIDQYEIEQSEPLYQFNGIFTNVVIKGLEDFDIKYVNSSIIRNKVAYALSFKEITIDTSYIVTFFLTTENINATIKAAGHANISVAGVDVNGTIKYDFSILKRKIILKETDTRIHTAGVKCNIQGFMGTGSYNRMMNNLIEKQLLRLINNNTDLISQSIDEKLKPIVNNILDEFKLTDLIGKAPKCEPENKE